MRSSTGRDAAIAIANKGFTVYATVRKQKDVDALNKLKVKNLKPIIMDVTNEEQIAVGPPQKGRRGDESRGKWEKEK